MAKKTAGEPSPHDGYWERRLRSKAFKRALTALVARELELLSAERVKDVVDVHRVRATIQEWDGRLLNRDMLADLIIQGNRRAVERLQRREESVLDLLDRQLVADIEAILTEDIALSPRAEDFVANLMQQEFIRRLFTDIIFTAIVSFYQKVNPLFGALTMRVLEEQIKGFIRLFMPMLQQQATAFAVSRQNQRILFDFARAIIRQLLEEPLHRYAALGSPGQRKKIDALIRKAVRDPKLEALIRDAALAAWDDCYHAIRDKTVGDLVGLDKHAGWLAERCVDVILPALSRPHILRFIAAEVALASAERK